MLVPDIYNPSLNPFYRDVLAHYGAVALPCRIKDPDRLPEQFISVLRIHCTAGSNLLRPHNIGGLPLPRDDWEEIASQEAALPQEDPETNCAM